MSITERLNNHIIFLRNAWACENAQADDNSFDLLKESLEEIEELKEKLYQQENELEELKDSHEELIELSTAVADWWDTGDNDDDCLGNLYYFVTNMH